MLPPHSGIPIAATMGSASAPSPCSTGSNSIDLKALWLLPLSKKLPAYQPGGAFQIGVDLPGLYPPLPRLTAFGVAKSPP